SGQRVVLAFCAALTSAASGPPTDEPSGLRRHPVGATTLSAPACAAVDARDRSVPTANPSTLELAVGGEGISTRRNVATVGVERSTFRSAARCAPRAVFRLDLKWRLECMFPVHV